MFQLTKKEFENLKSQFVTSSWGGLRRAVPYAFTEHGISMLSSVLNSSRAIQMNIYVIRAFIKMRKILSIDQNIDLQLFKFQIELKKQGKDIDDIIHVLKKLLNEPIKPSGRIGFQPSSK